MARNFTAALALAAAVALTAAGCKQADGPLQDASAPDRIGDMSDIGKDLMAVQAKDPSGTTDFVDDLSKLCGDKPAEAPSRELAARVASAVQAGGKLTMPDAVKLGTALWQTVAGREISQSQAEALRDEVKQLLTSAGVTDTAPVLEQMEAVQQVVNQRPPRWYEFF
ncbi:MAG: hypothetical protein AB7I25_08755 [Vicinamibacterales bacterium]